MLSDNFTDEDLEIVLQARRVTRAYRWPAHFLRTNSAITPNRIYLKLNNEKQSLFELFDRYGKMRFHSCFLVTRSTESESSSFEFYPKHIHRISLTSFASATPRMTWYV